MGRLAVLAAVALAAWAVVVGAVAGGRPGPVAVLVLAGVAVAALARGVSLRAPPVVPAVLVVVAAGLAVRNPAGLYGGPLDSTLGYANATAAFFALVAAAGLLVAVRCRGLAARWMRWGGVTAGSAAALAAATVPVLNGSLAGAVAVGLLPAALLARRGPRAVRRLVASGAVAVLLALAGSVLLGATHPHGGAVSRLVASTLSERRPALWADALDLAAGRPGTGIGPGRFGQASPVARSDADVDHAHSAVLEVAAELGLPGAVLALATLLGAFAWLAAGRADAAAAVGAVALAGLGLHASLDYVLHFPAVLLAGAALLGAAGAPVSGQQPSNGGGRPASGG